MKPKGIRRLLAACCAVLCLFGAVFPASALEPLGNVPLSVEDSAEEPSTNELPIFPEPSLESEPSPEPPAESQVTTTDMAEIPVSFINSTKEVSFYSSVSEGDQGVLHVTSLSGYTYYHPALKRVVTWAWTNIETVSDHQYRVSYCVDLSNYKTNSGDLMGAGLNWTNLNLNQRRAISHIMRYGPTNPYGTGNASDCRKYIAAQSLIWEVVHGGLDPVTLAPKSGTYEIYNNVVVRSGVVSEYNDILSKVKAWREVPSFASLSDLRAPTHKMEPDGSGYKAVLQNTNASADLANFDFQNGGGVTYTKSGQTLTVKSTGEPPSALQSTVKGDLDYLHPVCFWFDGGSDPNQTRATFLKDPVPAFFKLSLEDSPDEPEPEEPGKYYIEIQKLQEGTDIPLAGAQFSLEYLGGNGEIVIIPPAEPTEPDAPDAKPTTPPTVEEPEHHWNGSVTTGAKGTAKVTVPYAGVYRVVEEVPPAGHKLAAERTQTVSVNQDTPNATAHVTYHNEPFTSVQVQKIDAQTKAPLAGATFRLEQIAGGSTRTGVSGADGIVRFEDLPAGSYRVTEISPPPNYHLSTEPMQAVELKANETAALVFEDEPFSGFRIKKVDAHTGQGLAGAVFTIRVKDGELVGEYVTDINGLIVKDKLPEGWYTITEQQAPEGYLLDMDNRTRDLYIRPEDQVEVVFRDFQKPKLFLEKRDAGTGQPLSGATFRIAKRDSADYTEATTGPDGTVLLEGLAEDWYVVQETIAPPGYLLDDTLRNVELKAGETVRLVLENTQKPSLKIRKLDALTKQPLAHAVFQIQIKNGKDLGAYRTDEAGEILLDGCDPAVYVITEITAPNGYELLDAPVEQLVEPDRAAVVEIENTPKNPLLILKRDSVSRLPVAGARFSVSHVNGAYIGEFESGQNGYCTVTDLSPGYYTVTEVRAAPGYLLDGTPHIVELRAGKPAILEVYNTPLTGLQLIKRDSVTKQPIPGVRFLFRELDGRSIGTYTTDSTGAIFLPNRTEGWIEYVEVEPAPGYKADSTPHRVELKSGQPNVIEAENHPWPTLSIRKTNPDGKPLQGVKIKLFDAYSRELGTFTTNRLGRIALTGIDAGEYSVQEVETLPGYELDSTVHEVALSWGKTTICEIQNQPLATLRLRKVDADTGKPIYGVAFLLYDSKNNVLGEYTTDQNGVIEFPHELPEGKYKVKEIRAASGYVLDDTIHTVTLKSGETAELTVKNEPIRARIQIIKKSAAYNDFSKMPAGSLLRGAVFEVFDQSNTVVDRITTDRRGVATSRPLPLGVYGVREIAAPQYYQLNPAVFWAKLRVHGELVQFEVRNENEELSVDVQKSGNVEAMLGDLIRYDFQHIANTSSVPLENFYWHELLPTDAVRVEKVVTGTWSERLTYKVQYKTNRHDYRTLADNLSSEVSYELDCGSVALKLASNEYVTDLRFCFGTVQPGFREKKVPRLFVTVNGNLPNEYRFTNRTDVGGRRGEKWVLAKDAWTTIVYAVPNVKLPKTGF